MRGLGFLIFVALTVICWGIYGPVLHEGQHGLGADARLSSLRPFICVGIAYFLIAVLFPVAVLWKSGERGYWSLGGFFWSFFAGALGALGALGIILAFKFQGKPSYVMPLVFGGAPVVNTLVTMFFSKTFKEASALFYAGVLIVAIGAAGVLWFKPRAPSTPQHDTPIKTNSHSHVADSPFSAVSWNLVRNQDEAPPNRATTGEERLQVNAPGGDANPNYWLVIASIALTALCWGAYGPILHRGQMLMGQSRLRPFLCVGLAYFVIAVVATNLLAPRFPEVGGWNFLGVTWSLLGGAAGAFGALGIIYAFNYGGKPIFVMPLVFGLAPVVNTFTEIIAKNQYESVQTPFYLSLMVTILGAVLVLVCAPKSHSAAAKPGNVGEVELPK